MRLDELLADRLPDLDPRAVHAYVMRGLVVVDGVPITSPASKVAVDANGKVHHGTMLYSYDHLVCFMTVSYRTPLINECTSLIATFPY